MFHRHFLIGTFSLILLPEIAQATETIARYNQDTTDFFDGDEDWDSGRFKAECPAGEYIIGLSGSEPAGVAGINGVDARCGGILSDIVDDIHNTHSLETFANDRGTTASSDWDVGFAKAECGPQGIVAGISQTTDTHAVSKILCRDACGWDIHKDNCNTLVYSQINNELENQFGYDWSVGFFKNSCWLNRVLTGVSRNQDGTIHALLCCWGGPPNTPPSQCDQANQL